jgi:PelA/Pel-15E family pectate lyase
VPKINLLSVLLVLAAASIHGAVVGTSVPAQSITAERIARLPKGQQAAWKEYLDRSMRQKEADRAVLRAELKAEGLSEALIPPSGSSARTMPLTQPAEWYASPEARHIADAIVSFQTPAGGWSKNLNVEDHARRKGESFAPNNLSHFLGPDDFDTPADPQWNYVGTLDNDATTTELQFLAKVIAAVNDSAAYRACFLHGIEYLFAAQFPNGGWPQVWPLEGGYHDAITFNDGAVTETLELLEGVAERKGVFAFVPADVSSRASGSVARGVDCILATQILENGRRTVWGQQHDALTLQPVAGRNYEPRAECSSESAAMMLFLMNLPHPSAKVVAAVHTAATWFEQTAIRGKAYVRGREGAKLIDRTDGKSLWARFYEIGTARPIFGDRDKSIHDTMAEISEERRKGYGWYNEVPQTALDRYAKWRSMAGVRE